MPRATVTTIEQLKRRRHLLLDLGPEKRYERKFTRINPQEVVGVLKGQIEGQLVDIMVELGKEFWVGRNSACDLVIDSPWISSWHFRLYAVRTTSNLSVVCLQVHGTRGVLLNGKSIQSDERVCVHGDIWTVKTIVLLPGDTLAVPGRDIDFVYKHNDRQHRAEILELQSRGSGTQLTSLFRTTNTSHSTLFEPWQIHNLRLGHGAFGVVYLATHRQGLLQGAVKAISIQAEEQQGAKMSAERAILKRLAHPNVVRLFDTIESEEAGFPTTCLVLQLAAGGDLFSYLEKHGALTEDEVRFAGFQLFKSLDYLHENGVAHRDIKLENILLSTLAYMPRLLIADFGMAKTRKDILDTVPGSRHDHCSFRELDVSGTMNYLPPERIKAALTPAKALAGLGESLRGAKEGRRELIATEWFRDECHLDTWACGVLLFTLASGQHPYEHGTFHLEQGDADAGSLDDLSKTATSWHKYRATYGETRVGEVGAKEKVSWEKMFKAIIAFRGRDPTQWAPEEAWGEFSENGKDLLQGLLEYMAVRRLTFPMALRHRWIEDHQSDLDYLYDRYVIHDKIDTPPKM